MGGRALRVRPLGGNRAGEIRLTRFLRNSSVTSEEMVSTAAERTATLCEGRSVLAIQDTTVVRSTGGGGLYLHVMVAVDATSGDLVGLIEGRYLSRTAGRKADRRSRPVEQKESGRWLDAADRAAEVCRSAASVTVVADRESDIYEAFARRPEGVDLLVRAAQDRALADGGRLFARLDAQPAAARAVLDLPAKPGRKARQAQVAVRFMQADLSRPANGKRQGLPKSVPMTLVDIREVDPPAGEPQLHWRLLTSLDVPTAVEALAVVDLYRRRWCIEQLFRTMKAKGFDIEGVLVEEEPPVRRLVAATLVAAVIIQQLVHARDGYGGDGRIRPLTDAFDAEDLPLLEAYCADLEGKTERQKNPHPKGSMAYAAWVCARLGGWTGYYGKPGPVVMLQGWIQFQSAKYGLTLLGKLGNV